MSELLTTIFVQPILNLLVWLYNTLPGHDIGIAIIALTILVKLVLYPLTHIQIKQQRALQGIQPKIDEIRTRLKDNKEAQAKAGGRTLLKPDDYDEALLIRDAVHADPVARVLLEGARRELSIFWTDEETGIECRARLDAIGAGPADLKRAANGSPHGFRMAAAKYGYAIQAAHYLMGCRAVGLPTDGFRFPFIAVEPNGRHPIVSVYDLDDDSMQRGLTDRANALRVYAECLQTNVWPGYVRQRTTIRLPYYALVDNEEE